MKKRTLLEWGLLLPIIGVTLIMVRSELQVRNGQSYRIAVAGYDPRDLLHGHYLSIRYNLKPNGLKETESFQGSDEICFVRDGQQVVIFVRDFNQFGEQKCTSVTTMSHLRGSKRYLVPEADALKLEEALRDRNASVDLIVQANGDTSMGMLYLDDVPWRETLNEDRKQP